MTVSDCLYCFEALAAALEKRTPLTLGQVRVLWTQYQAVGGLAGGCRESESDEDNEGAITVEDEREEHVSEGVEPDELAKTQSKYLSLRPLGISRLQAASPASASTSTSSTPSTLSTTSSQTALGESSSKSSSKSSLFSLTRNSNLPPIKKPEEYPLFVTWNTVNSRGHKALRGCIGTFEAQELATGLRSYALTSAFDDTRFSPITRTELSTLSNSITLLTAFTPCANPLDWDLGTHGLRIAFSWHGKRYSATYLPDVALEQGWTKEETVISLMRKAGWSGRSSDWKKVSDLRCVRYEGRKSSLGYEAFNEWRKWVQLGQKK